MKIEIINQTKNWLDYEVVYKDGSRRMVNTVYHGPCWGVSHSRGSKYTFNF